MGLSYPSTVSEQLISSSSTGSNAFEQLEAALLGFASSEQVAVRLNNSGIKAMSISRLDRHTTEKVAER